MPESMLPLKYGTQGRILHPRNGILIPFLLLSLLTLVACARIGVPNGWSGGAIVDNTIYIGTSEGELRAIDRINGDTIWRFALQGEERFRAVYGTPAVTEDTIYVGGYDSILYALSLDGDLKWQEPLGDSIVGSPVIDGDFLLVGSSDGNLYAFNAIEETEEWRFPTGGKVWSTPAVADDVVYFGSLDHNIYAVSLRDGVKQWEFPTGGAVAASPVVARGRVYVGAFDGVFYAIDADTGSEVWRFEEASNWFWGRAITKGDIIYVPSLDGNLYALEMDTGRLRWKIETDGPIVGSPAIVFDELLAIPSSDGKIRLARLNGTQLDTCNIDEAIRTPLVVQDDFIYFGATDRSIRALKIKQNGNPDEEWVHFADKDDPIQRGRAAAC
jgi:outer membrane protein assembly factor BamB